MLSYVDTTRKNKFKYINVIIKHTDREMENNNKQTKENTKKVYAKTQWKCSGLPRQWISAFRMHIDEFCIVLSINTCYFPFVFVLFCFLLE